MANDSIGKVSLDMEIQSDLDKQIRTAATNIGKQIENALNKSGVDTRLTKLFDGVAKALNNNLKKTMDNLSKQIDSYLRKLTQVQMPTVKAPQSVTPPKSTGPSVQAPRGPPVSAPKVKIDFNSDVAKSQMETIESEMDLTESRIRELNQKLAELQNLYDQTFNAQKKNKLKEEIFKTESSVVRLVKKMDTLGLKYSEIESKLASLSATNTDTVRMFSGMKLNIPTKNIAPAVSQVSGLNDSIAKISQSTAATSTPLQNMSQMLKRTFSVDGVRTLGDALKTLQPRVKTTSKSFSSLIPKIHLFNRAAKTARGGNDYFKNGLAGTLKQMFKWMIILPMLVKGITAMARSLHQSLQTNKQFSTSLAQIKTNLMVAFTPIYQAILPAINTLMSALSKATAYIASFISQLFGKTYQQSFNATQGLISAKDAMGAYGSSTKAATKAAEKFNRTLAGFDKIEKLDTQSDGADTDGVESSAPGLAQPSIDAAVLDSSTMPWVKKFKDVLSRIFQPFKEAWAAEGQNTINAMKNALNGILGLVRSIGKSFLEVWTNGTGTLVLINILQIFQGIFNLIGNIAVGLDEAWNKNNTGTAIVQALFDILNAILGTINHIISATVEWAAKLDFSPLLVSVQTLLEAIAPFTETIGAGLYWFWEKVLLPIAGWAMQTAVPTFLDMLSAALDALNSVLQALQPLGVWLLDNLLKPLGEWAGDVFIGAMKIITDLLKKFSDWCSEHQTTVQNIALAIGSFAAVITAGDVISGIMTFISSIGGISGALTTLGGGITTIVAALGGPLTIAIGAAIAIGLLLWKNWDTISAKAKEVWEFVKTKFQEFSDFLANVFVHDWTAEFGIIGEVINGWLKNVSNVWNSVKSIFGGIIDFISGVFSGNWKKAWGGIKDTFKGMWDLMVSIIKSPINLIIGAINGLVKGVVSGLNLVIGALNKLSFDIPDWVPKYGGKKFGFDISKITAPRIPYLAQGGYVKANTPQLAMIGDNKRHGEIVAPEDKMQAMVDAAVKAATGNGISKAELESIINYAVTRIVAAILQSGAEFDSDMFLAMARKKQKELDYRYSL